MYELELLEIRRYHELKNISDEEIVPYIEIAIDELSGAKIKDENKTKALCFMTLKLLGQKLWHKIQQRANEYDETLETFRDVEKWEAYWQDRLDALISQNTKISHFTLGVI